MGVKGTDSCLFKMVTLDRAKDRYLAEPPPRRSASTFRVPLAIVDPCSNLVGGRLDRAPIPLGPWVIHER